MSTPTLACSSHGEGDPLLLLHGFLLSGLMFGGIVPRLPSGWRVLVPDLPGHGLFAARPRDTVEGMAEDVAATLDALGVRRPVVVCGFSLGGYVALALCRRIPDRVRALALISTRAQADPAEARRARYALAASVRAEGIGPAVEHLHPLLFAGDAPDVLTSAWRERLARTAPRGAVAALQAMARRPGSFHTLRSLQVPVLVVVGEEDVLTPPADAERMHGAAPYGTLVRVPGAGHMVPVERPAAVAAALGEWLGGLS